MCRDIRPPAMAANAHGEVEMEDYSFSSDNATYFGPDISSSLNTPIFMICTVIVGTLGNGGVIYILLRNRDMRNIPNFLILNLSLGDFLYLALSVPFNIATHFNGPMFWNSQLCSFVNAIQFTSQGVSVLSLTALSADRYYAIARPLKQRQSDSTRRTLALAAGTWILSIIFSIPSILLSTTENGGCSLPYLSLETNVYFVVLFVGLYIAPLVVISVFYSLTAIALLNGTFRPQESRVRSGANEKRLRSRTRLAVIILIAAVCFAICWFPYYLFVLWFEFGFETSSQVFGTPSMLCLYDMHYLLPILGSCLNPIILFVMSSNYRRHLRDMFCCFRCNSTAAKRHFSSARSWTVMSLRTNTYSLSPSSVAEVRSDEITHHSHHYHSRRKSAEARDKSSNDTM